MNHKKYIYLFGLLAALVLIGFIIPSHSENWPPWGSYDPLKLLRSKPFFKGDWTFVAYGDSKGSKFNRERTIPALLKLNPTLIINTGDMVNYGYGSGAKTGDWPEWEKESRALRQQIPFFPAFGNHEYRGKGFLGLPSRDGSELYSQFYDLPKDSGGNGLYYSFVYDNVTFIFLATWGDSLHPGTPQWKWLETIMKEAKTPHIVTVTHIPVYTVGSKPNWEFAPEFTALIKKYGVRLHLSGHDHIYYRTVRDGITFIITAGGGAEEYDLRKKVNALPGDIYFSGSGMKNKKDFYYYTLFEVQGETITGKAISINTGRVLDSFTINSREW
jgi:acid phosphatase type 7